MNSPPYENPERKERAFLRVPFKKKAKIFVDKKQYRNILINELSSIGLSFNIASDSALPEFFVIQFRFPTLRSIKTKVQVKNRTPAPGTIRMGVLFYDISRKDRFFINDYLSRYADFLLPCALFGVSAIMLSCDVLMRYFMYFINAYYEGAVFLKDFPKLEMPARYLALLIVYGALCFAATVFTNNAKKRNFILSIFFITLAFTFIAAKNLTYWTAGLWQSDNLLIQFFLCGQYAVLGVTALAITESIVSFKRVTAVLDSLNTHIRHNKEAKRT